LKDGFAERQNYLTTAAKDFIQKAVAQGESAMQVSDSDRFHICLTRLVFYLLRARDVLIDEKSLSPEPSEEIELMVSEITNSIDTNISNLLLTSDILGDLEGLDEKAIKYMNYVHRLICLSLLRLWHQIEYSKIDELPADRYLRVIDNAKLICDGERLTDICSALRLKLFNILPIPELGALTCQDPDKVNFVPIHQKYAKINELAKKFFDRVSTNVDAARLSVEETEKFQNLLLVLEELQEFYMQLLFSGEYYFYTLEYCLVRAADRLKRASEKNIQLDNLQKEAMALVKQARLGYAKRHLAKPAARKAHLREIVLGSEPLKDLIENFVESAHRAIERDKMPKLYDDLCVVYYPAQVLALFLRAEALGPGSQGGSPERKGPAQRVRVPSFENVIDPAPFAGPVDTNLGAKRTLGERFGPGLAFLDGPDGDRSAAPEPPEAPQPASPAVILVLGRPGSGKSTIAKLLAEKLGYLYISLGDLRRELKEKYPNEPKIPQLAFQVVESKLKDLPQGGGVVIDRNMHKGRSPSDPTPFDKLLERTNARLGAVINVDVPEDVARQRMTDRNRPTDTPEKIEKRQQMHNAVVEPLIEQYRQEGKIIDIDNTGPPSVPEGVIDEIKRKLDLSNAGSDQKRGANPSPTVAPASARGAGGGEGGSNSASPVSVLEELATIRRKAIALHKKLNSHDYLSPCPGEGKNLDFCFREGAIHTLRNLVEQLHIRRKMTNGQLVRYLTPISEGLLLTRQVLAMVPSESLNVFPQLEKSTTDLIPGYSFAWRIIPNFRESAEAKQFIPEHHDQIQRFLQDLAEIHRELETLIMKIDGPRTMPLESTSRINEALPEAEPMMEELRGTAGRAGAAPRSI
jgi:adenylate kinase family enzyme